MIKKITAGLMLPWLFVSSAFGQKKNLEAVVNSPITYEEKIEKDTSKDDELGINIIINYNNKQIRKDKTSYVKYESALVRTHTDMTNHFNDEYSIDSDFSDVNTDEKTQVENIFQNIIDRKINSYSEFIKQGNNLNEDQKLMLLNIWAERLNHNYSDDDRYIPQNTIFWYMADSLRNDNYHANGDCTPISFSTEKAGEDIGKEIDVVSGVLHAYNIIDTKKGLAIIDSYNLLRLENSYDVEEILKIYQKIDGKTAFEHYFFDKGKLKQILITENGRRFLEAVKYENPKNSLEKTLITKKNRSSVMEFEINQTNYLNSCSNNIMGAFLRMGKIKGDSAMKEMFFYQFGFDRDFLFKDKLKLDINSSYIGGQIKELRKIEGNAKEEYKITIFPTKGFMADLGLAYYDLYGINIGAKYSFLFLRGDQNYKIRVGGGKHKIRDDDLIYKNELGIGASYNFQVKNFNLKPYLIMNEGFYLDNIKSRKSSAILMEYGGGVSSELEISPFKIEINPYCFISQNEKEFGTKGNLEFCLDGKKFGIEGNFSDIKSNYIFNPNKRISGAGVYVQIGKLGIKIGHETETKSDIKNRWLEHEHNYNLNMNYNF